jgi:hypothetical protein
VRGSAPTYQAEDGPVSPNPVEATIIGGSFEEKTNVFSQYVTVYLNAGLTQGVKEGMIFPLIANQALRKNNSLLKENSRVFGRVRIVKATENYSTAVVIQSSEEVRLGDKTSRFIVKTPAKEDTDWLGRPNSAPSPAALGASTTTSSAAPVEADSELDSDLNSNLDSNSNSNLNSDLNTDLNNTQELQKNLNGEPALPASPVEGGSENREPNSVPSIGDPAHTSAEAPASPPAPDTGAGESLNQDKLDL